MPREIELRGRVPDSRPVEKLRGRALGDSEMVLKLPGRVLAVSGTPEKLRGRLVL